MTTYVRIQPTDRDAEDLLDPDKQRSEPWGGGRKGECDKCHGDGWTWHECASCNENGARGECPSCSGELRYKDDCPACEGRGYIRDEVRDGISVFPDEEGLYRYMLGRDADLGDSSCVVELEGEQTGDEDFDADEGALLVRPTRIVEVRSVDSEKVAELSGNGAPQP